MALSDARSGAGFGAVLFLLATTIATAQSFDGSFEFRWTSQPDSRHRIMITLSEVSFTDDTGTRWTVPAGTQIDGASIPPSLWTFAGSPFVGNYRRASVIHDHYCDIKTVVASKVHRMFRDAMEADGVGWLESRSKWLAVSAFGRGCGIRENILSMLSDRPRMEGLIPNERLLSELEQLQFQTRRDSVEARSRAIADMAQVENPRTFGALTAYQRVPSEENYEVLETAIRAEQPSDEELENLLLLSELTVPEGSIVRPTP